VVIGQSPGGLSTSEDASRSRGLETALQREIDRDGDLAQLQLLLLHHIGRRSGNEHIAPVSYMAHKDDYLLLGSFAGADKEPQWVGNLEKAAQVTVEVGTRSRTMAPTVLRDGPKRDALYQATRDHWPFVAAYESMTSRRFPVIQLTPID
jgi:deazaflavin-dependent oxidoreductase (nitroreductase family)